MICNISMNSHGLNLITIIALLSSGCGSDVENDTGKRLGPWDEYVIDFPSDDVNALLVESPFIYPDRVCNPVDSFDILPANATIEQNNDGEEQVCVWESLVPAQQHPVNHARRLR